MTDGLPQAPAPIPPPDRHQIERLNFLYDLSAPGSPVGWRGRIAERLRVMLARILFRQQEFNAALVDHINRNALVGLKAHDASVNAIAWLETCVDEVRRHQEALAAWERRSNAAAVSLAASQEELRTSTGALQQAVHALKREVTRLAENGSPLHEQPREAARVADAAAPAVPAAGHEAMGGDAYVGFEDRFRGSQAEIRKRLTGYLPVFQGADGVLDLGCGRGEFLALLRGSGVAARGVDINSAMIEVCREQGLKAEQGDALGYLRAQPDESLGGLFAAQVIEHLEPGYLVSLLDAAFQKLRPGSPIVLETINPACWFAFFESYIRDITHVRPIHPDTLEYLLVANGFLRVEIQYLSPYPEHEKLQPVAPSTSLGDWADTLNGNVERLNRLLFTCLDYAAIGRRP